MSNSYMPVKLAWNVAEASEGICKHNIILLHGFTSNKKVWVEISQKLADELKSRVYALDMRNHGDSEWSDIFNCDVMARDVANFIDEHCLNTAVIIGHSLGGRVAMCLALDQPEKVEALIVEDMPPTAISEELSKATIDYVDLMMNSLRVIPPDMEISDAIKFVGNEIMKHSPKVLQRGPEFADKMISTLELVKKEGQFAWKLNVPVLKKYILRVPSVNLKGQFEKPVLFLCGTLSPFNVPQEKDTILKYFPNGKLYEFENVTHYIHMERPDGFCRIISQFLDDPQKF